MEMSEEQARERYAQLCSQAQHLLHDGKLDAAWDKGWEADRFWAEYRRNGR